MEQYSYKKEADEFFQNRKILLIEDDEVDQRAFVRIIREMAVPYQYRIVGSCAEAREVIHTDDFDAVVSDYDLGDGTVFDLITDIKKRNVPLIVTTGFGDPETAVRALQTGATDYLVKDPSLSYLKMLPVSVERSISRFTKERLLTTLGAAVQQTRTSIAIASPTQRITYCNPGFVAASSIHKDEIIGAPLSSFFSDPQVYKLAMEAAEKGGIWRGEVRNCIDNNEVIWEVVSLSAILAKNGNLIGYLRISEDITSQKEAELSLAMEKERLSITLRSIGDAVLASDEQGKILFINPAAQILCGFFNDLSDIKISDIYILKNHLTNEPVPDSSWLLDSEQEQEMSRYMLYNQKTRTERLIEQHVNSLPLPDGSTGKVIVFRDITDAVRKEEEQRRLSQLESLGLLAGGIAHDLNNILTIILSNVVMARDLIEEKQDIKERLHVAEDAIIRAKSLSKQFLSFSPGGEPVREQINLETFLRSAPGGYIKGGDIHITYEIQPDIPTIMADPGQLGIAFHQVVRNAVEAMPNYGHITIRARRGEKLNDTDSVIIEVEDTGEGILPELLPKVFEPYFSTKKEMRGLGLTTAHAIITRHKGIITVDSTPGRGTLVRITLPAGIEKGSVMQPPENKRISGNRILIMDDEQMIQEILALMLQRMGYIVDIAPDGETTLSLFDQAIDDNKPYALIIMDLIIPGGMGGKDTIALIREKNSDIPVLVSSGYSNDPVMADYQSFGFSDTLPKPYSMQILQEKMDFWAPKS